MHQVCGTLSAAMADQTAFVLPKYENKTPSLACCEVCQRKFFTSKSYYNAPYGAEVYLRSKFDRHDCLEELSKTKKAVWGTRF
jgi:hypothetical protein